MVRSRIPELMAFFFPSAPPASKRFCISAAMLFRMSGEEQGDWARLVSLRGRRRGEGEGGGGEGGGGEEGGGEGGGGEEGRRGGGEEGRGGGEGEGRRGGGGGGEEGKRGGRGGRC